MTRKPIQVDPSYIGVKLIISNRSKSVFNDYLVPIEPRSQIQIEILVWFKIAKLILLIRFECPYVDVKGYISYLYITGDFSCNFNTVKEIKVFLLYNSFFSGIYILM